MNKSESSAMKRLRAITIEDGGAGTRLRPLIGCLLVLVLTACTEPKPRIQQVIYYTKDQVFNPQWNKARSDFENGLTSDEDFRYVVKHIQDQIENEKLSLDIELKAINQYIDERMGQ